MTEPRFKIRVFLRNRFAESKALYDWFGYDPDMKKHEIRVTVSDMLSVLRSFEDDKVFDIEVRSLGDVLLGETFLNGMQYEMVRRAKNGRIWMLVDGITGILNRITADNGNWMVYNRVLPKNMYFIKRYFQNSQHYFKLMNATGRSDFSLVVRGNYDGRLSILLPSGHYPFDVHGVPISFEWRMSCISREDMFWNFSNAHRAALNLGDEMDGV